MDGRDNGDIGAKVAPVPNGDFAVILDGQVEVAEKVPADFGVLAIVEGDGPLDAGSLPHLPQDFPQDSSALFVLVLVGVVVVHV